MTIFQRTDRSSDKTNEPDIAGRAAPRDMPQPLPEAVRTQASTPAPSPVPPKPQATHGTPMSNLNTPSVSVISKALKITGQLESSEDIQIDGQIEGDVRGVHVKVGNNAKVKGTVYGDEVEVAGTVEGKIEAKKVILSATAHMAGDVVHQDIRIESGAFIDGHCKPDFGKSAQAKQPAPAVSAAARTAAE